MRVVLGGRADQGRSADVDVLDHLLVADAAARGGALERVEVHDHEVDRRDAVLGQRLAVLLARADGEQAGEDRRVERLHAAVEDLREPGVVLDRADLDARAAELGGGAAGRDDLHAEVGERAREVDHAALVVDGQQRALDAQVAGHAGLTPAFRSGSGQPCFCEHLLVHVDVARVVGVDAHTAPGEQADRAGEEVVFRAVKGRQDLLFVASVGKRHCLLQDDRSGVHPVVHEMDRHAAHFAP